MPPFLPRKRSPPPRSTKSTPAKRAKLADALDTEATNNVPRLGKTRTFSLGSDSSSSSSSLSDVDSEQFEDVSVEIKHKLGEKDASDSDEDDEEEDNIEWEDTGAVQSTETTRHVPMANGPIQITLRKDDDDLIDYGTAAKAGSGKKGPSKREKQVRITTHQLHVQFLLWHNAVRNNWIGDKKVQELLVKQLPAQIVKEVEKWRKASGLEPFESKKEMPNKRKGKRRTKEELARNQRDWGRPSQRLEQGKPDMSHGDPLITLMKVLAAYWKKRFAITVPGLRKRGYGTKLGLKQDIVSLRQDEHDPEIHGERIRNLQEFRKLAQVGEGSRDVGAQLFTALVRGLGIEARLVASLQPSGYGWTKMEQMVPRKAAKPQLDDDSDSLDDELPRPIPKSSSTSRKRKSATISTSTRTSKVISLDTDEENSNEDDKEEVESKDDDSIVDVTPSMPKQRRPKYDRDLVFPIYWTEVISPITNKALPVSPLILETSVATTPETLYMFEPRGAKAEKGRQVMAYVVAYSPDGSAKDVTVRYLRGQIWPGKTKGVRFPIQKVPIYDKTGRIKRYEDYDWFKQLMRPYRRSDKMRAAVDDIEESSDLVPQVLKKKNEEQGIDTLQSLKTSADFVLERFLRREEALRPDAEPVRTFVSGKGDKYKEESVYRRADVERCLTAESWHKEGRKPKLGEAPMKMVPVRAVTLTRKREAEEHERQYGEKQTQGLYSWDQTEWIIPDPIQDGIIPKNAYGNMDCFVPSMVPQGAVHIPLKGTVRICKKLEIDYAEAVTGFEFGNKRAVPVCTGVVVAKENERVVKDAWREWNEEQRRKEETKMEQLVLDLWRKFVLGLRIRERVQDMYGEDIGVIEDEPTGLTKDDAINVEDEDDQLGGGFMNDDHNEDIDGGFLRPHEETAPVMEELIMDGDVRDQADRATTEYDVQFPTPVSITSENVGKHVDNDSSASEHEADSGRSGIDSARHSSHTSSGKVVSQPSNHKAIHTKRKVATKRAKHTRKVVISDDDDHVKNDLSDRDDVNGFASKKYVDNDGVESNVTEDEEEKEEKYTPRPTRTRASRSSLMSKPAQVTETGAKPKQKSNAKTDSKSEQSPNGDVAQTPKSNSSRNDPVKHKATARSSNANNSTPKRPRGRPRKESTIVTSPYF